MNDVEHYLRKAETWSAAARDARTQGDREACLKVEASFRALAETFRRLADSRLSSFDQVGATASERAAMQVQVGGVELGHRA